MSNIMILTDGQTGSESCFVGGHPVLPKGEKIPECTLCGADQTFFLQVAFPNDHAWTGLSLAVFACTSCAHEDYLIPEMLTCTLARCDIPANYLSNYQRNFHFTVFETSQGLVFDQYQERVKFHPIQLNQSDSDRRIGQVGGTPRWILEDESPASYQGNIPMHFLLQVDGGVQFEIVQGAPPQMELGLTGKPQPSEQGFYQLFIGNAIYLFGTDRLSTSLVYAVTQVD